MFDRGSMSRTIIVTDGDQRSALATVRSLGRAGYRVIVCSSRDRSLAGSSRYCHRSFVTPDALHEPVHFAEAVAAIAMSSGVDVLLPVTEASLLAILPRRGLFGCAIPFPSHEIFRRACDKREVLSLAATVGIRTPGQVEIPERHSRAEIGAVRFPVVVKPSRSVASDGSGQRRTRVGYSATRAELDSALDACPDGAYPVLLQERIEGQGFAISVLIWNGELRAAFGHRRLREKPPSGGVSVLRESIALDAELLRRSVALLAALNWNGVAMVEFKKDARTGEAYLMEINPRLWGSLQLAIDAEVDFPVLLVQLALGERPAARMEYRHGVQTRWEWGEVDHLLACVFHSDRQLALPEGSRRRSRLAALGALFASVGSGARPEIARRDDFRPFVRETLDWFQRR